MFNFWGFFLSILQRDVTQSLSSATCIVMWQVRRRSLFIFGRCLKGYEFFKKSFYVLEKNLKRDVKTQKWKSKRPLWFKHRFRREWVYTILVYHTELRWNITNIVYSFYSLTIINNCKLFRKSTRFGPVYGSSFHFNEPIIRLNENLL